MVDQNGAGSNILYRDLKVDDDELQLRLTLWHNNQNGTFFTPATLGSNNVPNQQLRIDLIRPGAPLRTLNPQDILATMFRTRVGDPAELPPTRLRLDLGRFEDRTVRLRIAEVDNQFFFQAGVDALALVEPDDDRDDDARLSRAVRPSDAIPSTAARAGAYQR